MNRDDDGNESLGHYEPPPLFKGGQGRSDGELCDWANTLATFMRYALMAAAIVAIALIAVGVI